MTPDVPLDAANWQPETPIGRPAPVVALVPTPAPRRIRLTTIDDVAAELRRVYRDARCGRIDAQAATRFAFVLNVLGKTLEAGEIEGRLAQAEQRLRDHGLAR